MRFFATALILTATAMAMPNSNDGVGGSNSDVKFPVDKGTTVEQAQAKCGYDATVSCCKKAIYAHDITSDSTGPLPGVLQTAIGGGPGGDGLGLFGQCNAISANVPVLNIISGGSKQLLEQRCKRNVACCQSPLQNGNGELVGVDFPCVALGSLL